MRHILLLTFLLLLVSGCGKPMEIGKACAAPTAFATTCMGTAWGNRDGVFLPLGASSSSPVDACGQIQDGTLSKGSCNVIVQRSIIHAAQ